jgi:hypothetical protein
MILNVNISTLSKKESTSKKIFPGHYLPFILSTSGQSVYLPRNVAIIWKQSKTNGGA